jgi:hypothetical protein
MGSEYRARLFDDPIEKGLPGTVAPVTTGIPSRVAVLATADHTRSAVLSDYHQNSVRMKRKNRRATTFPKVCSER